MPKVVKAHGKEVTAIKYAPKGEYLVTSSDDGTVKLWDARTLMPVSQKPLIEQPDGIRSFDFSTDGKVLVTADRGGMMKKWEFPSGRELLNLEGHNGTVNTVVVLPDSFIASGSDDGLVRLWKPDVMQGESTQSNEGWLKLLDTRTWKELATLKGRSPGFSFIAFSRVGKKLATANKNGTITIWYAATEEEVKKQLLEAK